MSNSTAPSYETGDIVILNKQLPFSQYKIGDAVLYSPPNFPEIIIHRIYDIKYINRTYYFAIKGDSNPQPDSVPQAGNIQNIVLQNRTVNWTDFYGTNTTNPTAKYIVASYYPAKDVVYGKVIYRIPYLGWFFVPFNSPFKDPFHVIPLSLFSIFTIFYIIITIAIIFLLIQKANSELKSLLRKISSSSTGIIVPKHIKLNGIYTYIFYPLILFILIFVTSIPTSSYTLHIQLQSSDQKIENNLTITQLVYQQSENISAVISSKNKTTTTFDIWNESNILNVNASKSMWDKGNNANTGESYNLTRKENYKMTINLTTMFVLTSTELNSQDLGRFFNYRVPITENHSPIGLMTNNIYLKVSNSTYNNSPAYETNMKFSFIQDLIVYHWTVNAFFNKTTGYLESYQEKVTMTPWRIPETIGMIAIVSAVLLTYEGIRRNIQKKYDEKFEVLTNAKSVDSEITSVENEFRDDSRNNIPKTPSDTTDNSENSNTNAQNKLTWEEYKKLEDKE